jgi:hypothetical protein
MPLLLIERIIDMYKFKTRLLVALLTFGIGVFGVSMWFIKSISVQIPAEETKEVKEADLKYRDLMK